MRWTRARQLTADAGADGEAVWFWRSEAGAKFARVQRALRVTVATKQRSPRRARSKPLKPLRGEGRVFSAEPVVLPRAFFIARGPWVPAGARSSLRPLLNRRGRLPQSSGAIGAASARGFADQAL
jgi:hypothetical protein